MIGDLIDVAITIWIAIFCVFLACMFFVYMPAIAFAEAKCLSEGYPKSAVTWNLKRYCMTLDGAVTVRVDEL